MDSPQSRVENPREDLDETSSIRYISNKDVATSFPFLLLYYIIPSNLFIFLISLHFDDLSSFFMRHSCVMLNNVDDDVTDIYTLRIGETLW